MPNCLEKRCVEALISLSLYFFYRRSSHNQRACTQYHREKKPFRTASSDHERDPVLAGSVNSRNGGSLNLTWKYRMIYEVSAAIGWVVRDWVSCPGKINMYQQLL
jgi:hypothetical protein